MTTREFSKSAAFIAKRNVSGRVASVVTTFDQVSGHLVVIYVTDADPLDDDKENCELTCAELVAEFPEIRTAETHCITAAVHAGNYQDHGSTVYQRE